MKIWKKLLPAVMAAAIAFGCHSAMASDSSAAGDVPMGKVFEDFSVETTSGDTFSLSGALKEKQAVLINFFAAGCPYCLEEFPLLDEAAQKYGDKAAFIGVDASSTDTKEDLAALQKDQGIRMTLAMDPDGAASQVPYEGYPCTVILDKNGSLVFYQDYVISDAQTLDDVFGKILADTYEGGLSVCNSSADLMASYASSQTGVLVQEDPADEPSADAAGYKVVVTDQNGDPVKDVYINFCSEDQGTCRMEATDENGQILFEVPQDRYHLQILIVPDGYSFDAAFEAFSEKTYGTLEVQITRD